LYNALNVPHQPRKHWSEPAGWEIANALAHVISEKMKETLVKANYVAISCDEVTTVDNQQWLCIHAYTCSSAKTRDSHLLFLGRVTEGGNANNLKEMILFALRYHGGLDGDQIAQKVISFGADGASVFQGRTNGVTKQLQDQAMPYLMGVHDMAHRTNLAVKPLSNLPMVQKVEKLLQSLYSYFHASPKRCNEYQKLAEIVETSGLKILQNVATRWISMLEPLKRVLGEYKTLIVKMAQDANEESKAAHNLALLCNVHTLLALPCPMPLLESLNQLIEFAQSRSVFVTDYINAIKMWQAEIFMMYCDPDASFSPAHFPLFNDIVTDHSYTISQEWVVDLNDGSETLAFRIANHTYTAHQLGLHGEHFPVSRDNFLAAVSSIKGQCSSAAELLIEELSRRFPDSEIMEALGIVFPQYWRSPNCDTVFPVHMQVIKKWYCDMREISFGEGSEKVTTQVAQPLDSYKLDLQSSLFKLTMKSNAQKMLGPPYDQNPVSKLWQKFGCNGLLLSKLSEFMRLAKIAITTVLGSVEDERTFSSLKFIKSRLRNRLEGNLDTVVRVFS
jgi:hypothetical protein